MTFSGSDIGPGKVLAQALPWLSGWDDSLFLRSPPRARSQVLATRDLNSCLIPSLAVRQDIVKSVNGPIELLQIGLFEISTSA
jgi:hypothetical protein